jgi:hypothetical protein
MAEFYEDAVKVFSAHLNKNPAAELSEIRRVTSELLSHIDRKTSIESSKLHSLVERLSNFTILVPIPIPLDSQSLFSRGVRYEEADGGVYYENVSRMSYIPDTSPAKAQLGRLNPEGVAMFYASLNGDANSIGAVLSECLANPGDIFNLLISSTNAKTELKQPFNNLYLLPLGIFDYLRRGVPAPFLINDLYQKIYQLMRAVLLPEAMIATQLCDAFITDILKRPGCKELYEVTSLLGDYCNQIDAVDGIIFPSTKLNDHPNVAIKPKSVDTKLVYKEALSLQVKENFGYGMYSYSPIAAGIPISDKITWTPIIHR